MAGSPDDRRHDRRLAIFEVKSAANGFQIGWYYRLTDNLQNEPVGPYPNQQTAWFAGAAAARDNQAKGA